MAMGYNGQKFMMISIARKVNVVLKEIFSSIDLDLVDFKLEFGAYDNRRIILADEISPDSCRLWKKGTTESMDKDLFRKDEGDIIEAYKEILEKLNTQNTESK
jgi:phosphoribosylaminoimidazole-succinocarboxamide synthase